MGAVRSDVREPRRLSAGPHDPRQAREPFLRRCPRSSHVSPLPLSNPIASPAVTVTKRPVFCVPIRIRGRPGPPWTDSPPLPSCGPARSRRSERFGPGPGHSPAESPRWPPGPFRGAPTASPRSPFLSRRVFSGPWARSALLGPCTGALSPRPPAGRPRRSSRSQFSISARSILSRTRMPCHLATSPVVAFHEEGF